MDRSTPRERRAATAGPEAGRELSPELRMALPPRFEAVGEALASGSGTVPACEVAGQALAHDGLSLAEALDGLAHTVKVLVGTEPSYDATHALAVAWSDATLGYLHGLSCDDPLTGLSTFAHLRSRVSDLYRGPAPRPRAQALVVVAAAPGAGAGAELDGVLARSMRMAQLGDIARTVFAGAETIGHVAPGRVVVLAERDDSIGRRVDLLRRMLEDGPLLHVRIWIEGLPDTDEAAGQLLDELTRT